MPSKLACLFSVILAIIPGKAGNSPAVTAANDHAVVMNAGLDGFCSDVYNLLRGDVVKPDFEVFRKAMTGFLNLKSREGIAKNILTIIDFSISSRLERMWIIDLNTLQIIHHCLVAHGHNSGEEFASRFSNSPASHESSLGFYVTGGVYTGANGLSMILEGMEKGINDNARAREIVMHGADYVSTEFIRQAGRLGRSFGCPSIPLEDHEKIIRTLAGGSCLFIYYPDERYISSSPLLINGSASGAMFRLVSESCLITRLTGPCSVQQAVADPSAGGDFQGR